MIVRVLLWSLGDAPASLDEVRDRVAELVPLPAPSTWVWNEAAERFGVVLFDDDEDDGLPAEVTAIRELIGKDPDVAEEFDAA